MTFASAEFFLSDFLGSSRMFVEKANAGSAGNNNLLKVVTQSRRSDKPDAKYVALYLLRCSAHGPPYKR